MAESVETSADNQKAGAAGGAIAFALALAGLALCGLLLVRLNHVHAAMLSARAELAESRSSAVTNSLNRPTLPANTPLTVCNKTTEPVDVLAVVSSYHAQQGAALTTFNSSSVGDHVWHLAPHSTETLHLDQDGAPVWDGATVFYAFEARLRGRETLYSGAATPDATGCVVVVHD